MVDSIIRPTEIEGKEDKLVGGPSVWRSVSGLRAIPAVVNRLDQPGQTFVGRSPPSETNLFRRDQPLAVRNVG